MDLKEIFQSTGHRHPWEIVRSNIIISELSKLNPIRIIDIGSGDEYLANEIERRLEIPVVRIDSNYTHEEVKDFNKKFRSIDQIEPLAGDIILLADVLEHIEESNKFLMELKTKFSSSKLLITVPAMQFLFSKHDEFLGHFRRYNKNTITREITPFYKIKKMHYMFFSLLIFRIFQKLFFSKTLETSSLGLWRFDQKSLMTKFVLFFLKVDYKISRLLPGLSLIVVTD